MIGIGSGIGPSVGPVSGVAVVGLGLVLLLALLARIRHGQDAKEEMRLGCRNRRR